MKKYIDPTIKQQIVVLKQQGYSNVRISDELGVSQSTVHRQLKKTDIVITKNKNTTPTKQKVNRFSLGGLARTNITVATIQKIKKLSKKHTQRYISKIVHMAPSVITKIATGKYDHLLYKTKTPTETAIVKLLLLGRDMETITICTGSTVTDIKQVKKQYNL